MVGEGEGEEVGEGVGEAVGVGVGVGVGLGGGWGAASFNAASRSIRGNERPFLVSATTTPVASSAPCTPSGLSVGSASSSTAAEPET